LSVFVPVKAADVEADPEDPLFSLEVKNNLINLQAKQASFKEILKDIGKKTGIKVNIFEDIADKKVTLNINALPVYAVHTLLEKMKLENFAVVYDQQLASKVIYILPEGTDVADVLKGKTIIRPARFTDGKNVSRIKGRGITTITSGKNKVPVRYVKDEVLLKFHLGVTEKEIEEVLKKHNLTLLDDKSLSEIGYVKARIPDSRDIRDVIKEMRHEYKVKIPEPNYITEILTISDPLYENQWYVPDTNFDKAWRELKIQSGIKIAVIDTGVNREHSDLNGKVLAGYDFFNNDYDATDDHGHGTFVSGIIAAVSNKIGIKGLYDYAKILPVKVIDATGIGTYEDTAKGILYAADNGAKVINLSIGGYGFSFMLRDAVDYALEKGCVVVAAGGNDGIEQLIYPAAYHDVIGVSALGLNGQIWSSSNRGGHIDVSAPGVHILSTGMNNDYVYASGTSASAPMVSALAGVLVSEKPRLSSNVIEELIQKSAKDLGDTGRDNVYGRGEIDALAALKQKVDPFHDVAVKSIRVEPMIFEKDKLTYIAVKIVNSGTYKSETFDVILYEIIGAEKKEIDKKEGLTVMDRREVLFDWKPEVFKENVRFEVMVYSEKDADTSNNNRLYSFAAEEINGLWILHDHPPHQIIAYKAYLLLPVNVRNGFSAYIGPPTQPTDSDNNSGSTITEGTYDEDDPIDRACNHFWNTLLSPVDPDAGYDPPWYDFLCTSDPYQSAYRRAQIFWDNWVIPYYTGRDSNGNPWVKDEATAFWWLGRVAHLLADMSVPDHVHNDDHPLSVIGVGYEPYIKNNCSTEGSCLWSQSGSPAATSDLYSLFLSMAEKADDFDSGDVDGEVDQGSRRSGDFSDDEYREMADVLMPEIYKHIAGLYELFWASTDNDRDDDTDGYTENQGDCNDIDPAIHPNATEACDGVDNDCDGVPDGSEGLTQPCGITDVGECTFGTESCDNFGNWVGCTAIGPIPEICDDRDNDCDGVDDNGLPLFPWYVDIDGDGYGNPATWQDKCNQPTGWVPDNTDCDDNDAEVWPGGKEVRILANPSNTSSYYWISNLQTAFNDAVNGKTIQIKAAAYTGDLNITRAVSIGGGYDCSFSTTTGNTTINGTMTISDGMLTIDTGVLTIEP